MNGAPSLQAQGAERLGRVQDALRQAGWSALVCAYPLNVLMLSGYWPVIGSAVAIVTVEPRLLLLVPEDEQSLAAAGWADEVHTFRASPGAPQSAMLGSVLEQLVPPLGLQHQRIGYEAGPCHVPAPYVSLQVPGDTVAALLRHALPNASLVPGDAALQALRMRLTPWEIERVRRACDLAGAAYARGASQLAAGRSERATAALFQRALLESADALGDARADGRFYCMSGPNAAEAYAAYQRSRSRVVQRRDLVLLHCNSHVEGYWTDLTRTFTGAPDARVQHLYSAVVEAREAALETIRPGARAADVDRAARDVLAKQGYGGAFRHATGHGVGFAAIDHNERPVIAPQSQDVLEPGMVFNLEPGVYLDGQCGVRDCNMVVVDDSGCTLLSRFQNAIQDLQCEGLA